VNRWRIVAGALAAAVLVTACSGISFPPAGSVAKPTPAGETFSFSKAGWKTDFSKHSVPLKEISSGGPPRDGIPPIDHPKFVGTTDANSWLKPKEPVISFAAGDDHRAYPLQVLIWHEIVNDQVDGQPVTVTFCPLCNSAIAFDRRLGDRILDFGTSGNLRNSDLVMWDRQTESWWQQLTAEAIVGELTGQHLTMLPASIVSWADFKASFPEGKVLSRDTGHPRDYGRNPYIGYDDVDTPPFLYSGKLDGRLPPKERVVAVSIGGEDVAYPYPVLQKRRVVTDTVGGQQILVFFQPSTVSALDAGYIPDSRDVGATGVFGSQLDGRRLTFSFTNGAIIDAETGSRWNVIGKATSGPLQGRLLEPVLHADHFWFSWAAFKPGTRIFR
jgi:hypothetical protein